MVTWGIKAVLETGGVMAEDPGIVFSLVFAEIAG